MLLLSWLDASPSSAQEARRRVVLITGDTTLAQAARTVLAAWQLDLIVVADSTRSTVADDGDQLRQAAQQHAASAVVWSRSAARGSELVVYDAEADRLLGTRETSSPPFDPATATAIALSVKTLLWHATGMPEAAGEDATSAANAAATTAVSRDEAGSRAESPARSDAGALGSEPLPAPDSTAASDVGQRSAPPEIRAPAIEPDRRTFRELTLMAAGGFRSAMHHAEPEARVGVGAELWPAAGAFGIGLGVSAGSGFRLPGSEESARLIEPVLSLSALLRARASSDWVASAALGPALHVVLLRGELAADGSRIEVTRVTPQVQAMLRLEWRALDRLIIGIWGQAGLPLLLQRYWVGPQLALESRRLSLAAGVAGGVPFRW